MTETSVESRGSPDWLYALGWIVMAAMMSVAFQGARARGLEYDELWTLEHYARYGSVGRLFEDLATPNNHPLHSLMVRGTSGNVTSPEWQSRWPSLLAGMIFLTLIPLLAFSLTKSREIRFLSMTWCATNAAVLHFIQVSRGYAVQLAFITGCAWLVVKATEAETKKRRWWLAGSVVCGWGAVFTIPTALMFVLPIWLWAFVSEYRRRRMEGMSKEETFRREKDWLLAAGVWLMPTGLWFWHVREALTLAQLRFGGTIASLPEWGVFGWQVLAQVLGIGVVGLIVLAICLRGNGATKFWLTGLVIAPLLLAPVAGTGPMRIYLPLVPFGVVLAAGGAWAVVQFLPKKSRVAVVAFLGVLPLVSLKQHMQTWMPPDWRVIVPSLSEQLPEEVYPCYPAAAGFLVEHYYGQEVASDLALRTPTGDGFILAVLENEQLEGIDPKTFLSQRVSLPAAARIGQENFNGVRVTMYRAETAALSSTGLLVVAIGPGELKEVRGLMGNVVSTTGTTKWITVDGLLNPVVAPRPYSILKNGVVLVSPTSMDIPELLQQLARQHPQQIRLYSISR